MTHHNPNNANVVGELVDLTQEDPHKDKPATITITLNDSIQQPDDGPDDDDDDDDDVETLRHIRDIRHRPNPRRHRMNCRSEQFWTPGLRRHEQGPGNVRDVILVSSGSDSDSDWSRDSESRGPARKRQLIRTPSKANQQPPLVQPAPPPPQPTPPSPDRSLKCPICLETYTNIKKSGNKSVTTKCGHLFCDHCLKQALAANGRKCPKCRKTVPKGASGVIEVFDVC